MALVGLLLIAIPVPDQVLTSPLMLDGMNQGDLEISAPVWTKAGESEKIELRIHYEPSLNSTRVDEPLHLISRLEIGALDFSPKGEGVVSIQPNHSFGLQWKVNSLYAKNYLGTLWLFEKSATQNTLLLAREINFSSRLCLGLPYSQIKVVLIIFSIIGVILLIFKNGGESKKIS